LSARAAYKPYNRRRDLALEGTTMRKGLEMEYRQTAAAPRKRWPIDLFFPIVLVGAAYLAVQFIGF